MDLIVTNLAGQSELLTDFQKLQRTQRVNGTNSLSFILLKTNRNEHSFSLVEEESIIEYDNKKYRIKQVIEKTVGNTPIKQVTAHRKYFDLIDKYQYDTTSGTLSINNALDFALNGSNYTYQLIDTFGDVDYNQFGNENALSLLFKITNDYQAEIEVVDSVIKVHKQIGSNRDFQFRFNHNVKTIERNVDTSNLSTYIKGFGKQNADGTYLVTSDYTSPNADKFGIRDAKPVHDDRFTTVDALNNYLKQVIQDTPDISFKLTFSELKKAGYPYDEIDEGDTVYVIYEPLGIDITARVVEYVDYPESKDEPQVTLANFKKNLINIMSDLGQTEKQVKNILNESGNVKYNVLDEAVKIATQALNNSLTELSYPKNQGIVATDKTDPNKLVVLNSSGLGISKDGGITYSDAITGDGFVLSAGAIGQLEANNIKVGGTSIFDIGYDPSTKIDEGNDYNGVTINGIDGLVINSTNNQVTLNASKGMEILKGTTSIFSLDSTTGSLAITGDINMTGGTITWGGTGANPPNYTDVLGTKPPTNADNTIGAIGGTYLTHIGSNGIYTGTLSANQIYGGSITGVTINVGTDLTIGRNVFVNTNSSQIGTLYADENIYLGDANTTGVARRLIFNKSCRIEGGNGNFGGDITISADSTNFGGTTVDFSGVSNVTGLPPQTATFG